MDVARAPTIGVPTARDETCHQLPASDMVREVLPGIRHHCALACWAGGVGRQAAMR